MEWGGHSASAVLEPLAGANANANQCQCQSSASASASRNSLLRDGAAQTHFSQSIMAGPR